MPAEISTVIAFSTVMSSSISILALDERRKSRWSGWACTAGTPRQCSPCRQLGGDVAARRLRQEHQRPHAGRRKLHQRQPCGSSSPLREQRLEDLLHGLVDRPHDRHAVQQALAPADQRAADQVGGEEAEQREREERQHQAGAGDRPGQIGLRPVDRRNQRPHETVDPVDERPDQPGGDRQRARHHQAGEEIIADARGGAGMRRPPPPRRRRFVARLAARFRP